MNSKTKSLLITSIALAFILFHWISQELYHHYRPGSDEARQIESAVYLVEGFGYSTPIPYKHLTGGTSNEYINEYDNGSPLKHQSSWPPGLSLLVSMFILLGLEPLSAGFSSRMLILIIATTAAARFANRLGENAWTRVGSLMATLTIITLYISDTVTEVFVFALFLLLTTEMISSTQTIGETKKLRLAAILMGLAVTKYTAISIILSYITYEVYNIYNAKRKSETIDISKVLVALPAILLICLILMFNIIERGFFTDNLPRKYFTLNEFSLTWVIAPLVAIAYKSTFLASNFISHHFAGFSSLPPLIASAIVITTFFVIRGSVNAGEVLSSQVAKWFVTCFVITSALLMFVTVMFFSTSDAWVPISHGRYYAYLLPIPPALLMLILTNHASPPVRRLVPMLSLFFATIFFSLLNLITNKWYVPYGVNNQALVESVDFLERRVTELSGQTVLLFSDETFYLASLDIPSITRYVESFKETDHVPMNNRVVFIACTVHSPLPHQVDRDGCEQLRLAEAANIFGFKEIFTSEKITIFEKRFD